jgi:hypothetical protein
VSKATLFKSHPLIDAVNRQHAALAARKQTHWREELLDKKNKALTPLLERATEYFNWISEKLKTTSPLGEEDKEHMSALLEFSCFEKIHTSKSIGVWDRNGTHMGPIHFAKYNNCLAKALAGFTWLGKHSEGFPTDIAIKKEYFNKAALRILAIFERPIGTTSDNKELHVEIPGRMLEVFNDLPQEIRTKIRQIR